jgi:hypothetical protein
MTLDSKLRTAAATVLDAVRRAARQEQLLEVASAAEARHRFEARVDHAPCGSETWTWRGYQILSVHDPKQTCAARFGLLFDRQSEADDGFP